MTITLEGRFTTPEGTPLGGSVKLTVEENGDYLAQFRAKSSSMLGNFDFAIRAYLTGPGTPAFTFAKTGHVSGVDRWARDERGNNPLIQRYWSELSASPHLSVSKDWKWGGAIGGVQSVVEDVFRLGAGAVGAGLGVVIGVTQEAIGWMDQPLGAGRPSE